MHDRELYFEGFDLFGFLCIILGSVLSSILGVTDVGHLNEQS